MNEYNEHIHYLPEFKEKCPKKATSQSQKPWLLLTQNSTKPRDKQTKKPPLLTVPDTSLLLCLSRTLKPMRLNQITTLQHSFEHWGKSKLQCCAALKRQNRGADYLTIENGIKYRTTLTKCRVSRHSLVIYENMAPYSRATQPAVKRRQETKQHFWAKYFS